jgi:hypothetical protein
MLEAVPSEPPSLARQFRRATMATGAALNCVFTESGVLVT